LSQVNDNGSRRRHPAATALQRPPWRGTSQAPLRDAAALRGRVVWVRSCTVRFGRTFFVRVPPEAATNRHGS